jgi:putative ABC transport system ATP-binding protein
MSRRWRTWLCRCTTRASREERPRSEPPRGSPAWASDTAEGTSPRSSPVASASALDSKTGGEIMELLIELHREQGTAIVLVTHDPNVAEFAHRQVFMLDGRVVSKEEALHGVRH